MGKANSTNNKKDNSASTFQTFESERVIIPMIRFPFDKKYVKIKEHNQKFGTQYQLVRERRTNSIYWVKTLSPVDRNIYEKTWEELKILKKLNHPNILQPVESFKNDSEIYIVSEICEGGPVFCRLARSPTLSESTIASCIFDIANAVNHMHSNGVMHRNLRPDSLLFTKSSNSSPVKVTGFQHAKALGKKLYSAQPIGEIIFMSPEMIRGKYSLPNDVWSIGVLIHILLTGRPPFIGSTRKEILKKILKERLKFSGSNWKNVSEAAIDLLDMLLEKNPKKRPTIAEVLEHPWLQNLDTLPDKPLEVQHKLNSFIIQRALSRAISLFITKSSYYQDTIAKIQNFFKVVKGKRQAELPRETLLDYLKHIKFADDPCVSTLLSAVNKPSIHCERFLCALTEAMEEHCNSQLYSECQALDLGQDGQFLLPEDQKVLDGGNLHIYDLIKEARQDNGEGVDFTELCRFLVAHKRRVVPRLWSQ